MKTLVKALVALGLCSAAHAASAATIDVTVNGRSGPWDQAANPDLPYDTAAFAPTVVRSSIGSLAAGTAYAIAYTGGFTKTNPFYGPADGTGYSNLEGGIGFPNQYIPNQTAYLQELIGAFADSTGKVVGTAFIVGNGGSFIAPTGASEILLGINDNQYVDNLGSLSASVSGVNISAVPLPAAAPLFGAALLALAGIGYGIKRKQVALSV